MKNYDIMRMLRNIAIYEDRLRGDLQIQTNWTDGHNSVEEMAEETRRIVMEYIVVTDHTRSLAMAHGLDEARLEKQGEVIEQISRKLKGD